MMSRATAATATPATISGRRRPKRPQMRSLTAPAAGWTTSATSSPRVSRTVSAVFLASSGTSLGLPGPGCSGTSRKGRTTLRSEPKRK
jgi:hypothetical protein